MWFADASSDCLLYNKSSQNSVAPNNSYFILLVSLQLGLGKVEMACLSPLDALVPLGLWRLSQRTAEYLLGYKPARAEAGGHILSLCEPAHMACIS